jgi:hypothetical protein
MSDPLSRYSIKIKESILDRALSEETIYRME